MTPENPVRGLSGRGDGDGGISADAPVASLLRWMWVLSCGHQSLSDVPGEVDVLEFCPGCGLEVRVVGFYRYFDEEGAYYDPIDAATGESRR